jgi:hypothetical protein
MVWNIRAFVSQSFPILQADIDESMLQVMGLGLIVSSLAKHANHSNNPGMLFISLALGVPLTHRSMAHGQRLLRRIQQQRDRYCHLGSL